VTPSTAKLHVPSIHAIEIHHEQSFLWVYDTFSNLFESLLEYSADGRMGQVVW